MDEPSRREPRPGDGRPMPDADRQAWHLSRLGHLLASSPNRHLRRLGPVAALLKGAASFNPDEPRDESGRWTSGGGSNSDSNERSNGGLRGMNGLTFAPPTMPRSGAATVLAAGASSTTADVGAVLTNVGTRAAGSSLSDVAEGLIEEVTPRALAGTAAFASVLLSTSSMDRMNVRGAIPAHPDIRFDYDIDTGHFSIFQIGPGYRDFLASGGLSTDGTWRADDGTVLGRFGPGKDVQFNVPAIAALADAQSKRRAAAQAKAKAKADADAAVLAQAREDARRGKCPAAVPENINGRSLEALAYQAQITGNKVGEDVPFGIVRFDGCEEFAGYIVLLEAKYNMGRFMKDDGTWKSWFRGVTSMTNQMDRQVAAAPDVLIDWSLSDLGPTLFMQAYAALRGYKNVHAHYVPAIRQRFTKRITGNSLDSVPHMF